MEYDGVRRAPGTFVIRVSAVDPRNQGDIGTLTVTVTPPLVVLPDVVGLDQAAAEGAIVSAGLSVGNVTMQADASVRQGNEISQDPAAGTEVDLDTAVNLVISSGPPAMCTVPTVTGQTQADAEAAIIAAGCSVGAITTQTDPVVPEGNVISQDPAAGREVDLGTAVNLVVSIVPADQCDVNGDNSVDRIGIE